MTTFPDTEIGLGIAPAGAVAVAWPGEWRRRDAGAGEGEADDARGDHQDEADDHPQAARPRTRFAVIALAEKVIIHRRTPESGLICGLHDTLITGDGDVRDARTR